MEQLKEIMKASQAKLGFGFEFEQLTPQEYEQRKADVFNASEGNLHEADGYNCDLCKNKGFIAKVAYDDRFRYYSETMVPCKCQKARAAIRRLNKSGLKNIVKGCTFEKYTAEEPWQQSIKSTAIQFCKDEQNTWFFIGGQSGAGKTHLCTAIAVYYIKSGKEVRYMLWRDEIVKIKAFINDPAEHEKMMKELKETPVLYIDDLFKNGKDKLGNVEPPTAADVNVAFEILNYRYNNPELVTIISSERTLVELNQIDEAIAGRIAERTKEFGYCLNIKKNPTRNWRMRGIQEL